MTVLASLSPAMAASATAGGCGATMAFNRGSRNGPREAPPPCRLRTEFHTLESGRTTQINGQTAHTLDVLLDTIDIIKYEIPFTEHKKRGCETSHQKLRHITMVPSFPACWMSCSCARLEPIGVIRMVPHLISHVQRFEDNGSPVSNPIRSTTIRNFVAMAILFPCDHDTKLVPHTTQSMGATLTNVTPVIGDDNNTAQPTDRRRLVENTRCMYHHHYSHHPPPLLFLESSSVTLNPKFDL